MTEEEVGKLTEHTDEKNRDEDAGGRDTGGGGGGSQSGGQLLFRPTNRGADRNQARYED
jgi:hypothetical protein